MRSLLQDLRFGARVLARAKTFTLVAILTLGLGIGGCTAVFSLVDRLLLKPLPYPEAARIVFPWRQSPPGLNLGYNEIPWNLREFRTFLRESKTLENWGAFQSQYFNLTGSGDPVRLDGTRASSGFFEALGVAPALGRTFTADEDQPGRGRAVILSDRLWRERFGSDSSIAGRSIELNGAPYTVVGVMPPGFEFPRAENMPRGFDFPRTPQLWVPLALPEAPAHPWDPDELALIARLRPGVTLRQAQAEMDVLSRRIEKQYARATGWFNSRVTPLTRQVAGDTRAPLLLILGAVGIVLLIACSNVASLVLARSLARRREFTLRAALGAGNARLIRQVLTESVLLASGGGLAGILLAGWLLRLAKIFGPASIPMLAEAALDARVFAFALAVTLLTGILFGLAPALAAARDNLADSLKQGPRVASGALGPGARKALLVAQVALALVLAIAAGLLTRTFLHLLRVDPGFRPSHVLSFELSLPPGKYPDPARLAALYSNVLEQLRSINGVESAGMAKTVPLGGAPDSTGIRIPDHPPASAKERRIASYTLSSAGYFSAISAPILRGRDFLESDFAPGSRPVTIINRSMAAKYWPNQDALGKQVGPGSTEFPLMTVVGIVADLKDISLRQEPGPEMYVPYHLKSWVSLLTMQVALRTRSDPTALAKAAQAAIHAVDPDLPVSKTATLTELVDRSVAQSRFAMLLLVAFGALALTLACIGMYGVISHSVAQRTREIGVRIALGANARDVFALILGQGAKLAGAGVFLGLAAAFGVARLMAAFLYGVHPFDPLTFVVVPVLLASTALLASYFPARRASRVDPINALRYE